MATFYELTDASKLTHSQDQIDYWFQMRDLVREKIVASTVEDKATKQVEIEALTVPILPTE